MVEKSTKHHAICELSPTRFLVVAQDLAGTTFRPVAETRNEDDALTSAGAYFERYVPTDEVPPRAIVVVMGKNTNMVFLRPNKGGAHAFLAKTPSRFQAEAIVSGLS